MASVLRVDPALTPACMINLTYLFVFPRWSVLKTVWESPNNLLREVDPCFELRLPLPW